MDYIDYSKIKTKNKDIIKRNISSNIIKALMRLVKTINKEEKH